jgi:hypothetical protein
MARIVLRGNRLIIRLAWWERLLAFHGDLTVPLARVRDVIAPLPVPSKGVPLDWRVLRLPGTALPGVIQAGSYYRIRDGWEFYIMRRPSKCILIELSGGRYKRLIIQVDDETPESAARRILAARDGAMARGASPGA